MQKYIFISNDIRSQIMQGKLQANDQLPAEKDLCVHYGTSKMTIKKAVDKLVTEGLIIKRRGSGTFVKDLSVEEIEKITVANQFRGMTATYPDKQIHSKVLEFSVIQAPEIVRNKLNLTEGSFVYDIYRVRSINGQPTVMEKIYMPIDLIPGLREETIEKSIYGFVEAQLGLVIQSAHRTITVRRANEVETKYLEIGVDDPVAVGEQIAFLNQGTAFEYSISVHRSEDFVVEMVLTRS